MTRHETAWWSSLFATPPQQLLRRPAGERLVDVLTEWWMTFEGFDDGTWPTVDHSRRAAETRYTRPAFYAQLDAVGFPVLADGDEHAIDKIFDGFLMWTRSRKARTLIERLSDDLGSDVAREPGQDHGARIHHNVHHQVHHHVHNQVHQHVAHQVHQHVHSQVHHAVSHAAHSAGHSGAGHGGGGHAGGHH